MEKEITQAPSELPEWAIKLMQACREYIEAKEKEDAM